MWQNQQFPEDLVTFTEEILSEKLHFLCGVVVVYTSFSQVMVQEIAVFFTPLNSFRSLGILRNRLQ